MKKILITGSMGFVGSNLVKKIRDNDDSVLIIGVDNLLSSEYLQNIENKMDLFINGSIEDDSILKVLDRYDFDTVFHLATYHGNATSVINPLDDHQNGALTTLKLLEYFKNKELKSFVYSSAGCSMGTSNENNCKYIVESEEVTLKLDTPYQISKIMGEFYCNFYHKQFNLPTVRARFQNVYGPNEILGAGRYRGSAASIWRNVIPIFIYKALKNEPLSIYGSGEESRDFIFVEDVVDGLIKCATNEVAMGDVFNIAHGKQTTIKELAELILKLTNSSSEIIFQSKRDWDSSHQRYASIEKAKSILDFEANINLVSGLTLTIDWTKKNIDFIDKVINKHKGYK